MYSNAVSLYVYPLFFYGKQMQENKMQVGALERRCAIKGQKRRKRVVVIMKIICMRVNSCWEKKLKNARGLVAK